MSGILERNKTIQICVLVKDVAQTSKEWAKFLHVDAPEIFSTEKYEVTHACYNGQPCYGRIYQAIFDLDNIQIEIVGPVDDQPSYWYDYLQEHGEGLHHIAFFTKNMDGALEELEDEGFKVIQRGSWSAQPVDGQYAYITSMEKLKCCIELLCF